MKSLVDVAETLSTTAVERKISSKDLAAAAGVTPQTLVNILKHHSDFRVSNLLALADRLGLELLLVPKGAIAGLQTSVPSAPSVKSKIDVALARVRGASKVGAPQ